MSFGTVIQRRPQSMPNFVVLHSHLRSVGYCNRGARAFCDRHGIDWSQFKRDGIDSTILESIDDQMVRNVVEYAKSTQADKHDG